MKLLVLCLLMMGCTHAMHKLDSAQTENEDPKGLRVELGSKEIAPGDLVQVFRQTCTTHKRVIHKEVLDATSCSQQLLGESKVLTVLGENSAVIEAVEGIEPTDQIRVEKKK